MDLKKIRKKFCCFDYICYFCAQHGKKIYMTLATKSYINLVRRAHGKGYMVHLLFFWLKDAEMAKQRVAERVACGGHNIPSPVIERRYEAGIKNLFEIYMKEVDLWVLYDNCDKNGVRIAFGGRKIPTKVNDKLKFNKVKDYE